MPRKRRSFLALHAFVVCLAAATALLRAAPAAPLQRAEPALDDVVARMSQYVAGYGEQASLIVAVEKYQQNASTETGTLRPRRLTAEFVIVRAEGAIGWIGFRDVIEVEGKQVTERGDRLAQLFMASSFDGPAVTRIANESARYNVGPTIRNFNVPTTALFFFHPANVGRFTFKKKGTKKIGSLDVWEITFTETKRPTLVMKRDGTDVPSEGTVWVEPADGTIVRTRLQLHHFADQRVMTEVAIPQAPTPPPPPSTPIPSTDSSGKAVMVPSPPPPPPPRAKGTSREAVDLQSLADIDVTYERDQRLGLWVPSKMTEIYEGPMVLSAGASPRLGRTTTEATYSDFKRFQTSTKITLPK